MSDNSALHIPKTMRAVILTEPTPGEDVALAEVPVPSTSASEIGRAHV